MQDDWLRSFNDPALEAIVAEAIANNLDLRRAAQRVRIAQETAVVVGARLSPWVVGQLGARSTRDDDHDTTFNSKIGYASVGWELDIWGLLRAQHAAAQAGYEATALDYAYARQSLAATTAKLWFLAIETRQLVALAEQAVQVFSDLLRLVEMRRNAGKDSDLDVVDVRARLDTAQSALEGARQSYGEVQRALEELLGRYPGAEIEVASEYPALTPLSGAGIPSTLLERRPDIMAAERDVLATFRGKEAAELALLPQFTFLVHRRPGRQRRDIAPAPRPVARDREHRHVDSDLRGRRVAGEGQHRDRAAGAGACPLRFGCARPHSAK